MGLHSAATAAARTATQATAGRDPGPYFGISAQRVCVIALDTKTTAVQPGPLPTDHPVLAFNLTGEETWLWDPARVGAAERLADMALRVPTSQVTTRPAAQGARSCPSP